VKSKGSSVSGKKKKFLVREKKRHLSEDTPGGKHSRRTKAEKKRTLACSHKEGAAGQKKPYGRQEKKSPVRPWRVGRKGRSVETKIRGGKKERWSKVKKKERRPVGGGKRTRNPIGGARVLGENRQPGAKNGWLVVNRTRGREALFGRERKTE